MIFNFKRNKTNTTGKYCARGFVGIVHATKSFYKDTFNTKEEAENYVFDLISKYELQVARNENVDSRTNEIVCDNGRFTILKRR